MLKIRKAIHTDIPLIKHLAYEIWPHAYSTILSPEKMEYMLGLMYSESSLLKQTTDGCQFLIVNEGTDPVGFASFQEIEPTLFKLHKLYILPTQQGKGTGRFVINYIIEEIQKQDASSLQLQVNRGNKAKGFYEKLGFAVVKEINLDIGNGFFMDDYIMEKII